jgi:hypothetical protein
VSTESAGGNGDSKQECGNYNDGLWILHLVIGYSLIVKQYL